MWIALSCLGRVVPARDKAVGSSARADLSLWSRTPSLRAWSHKEWSTWDDVASPGLSTSWEMSAWQAFVVNWGVCAGTTAELPVHRQPEWEVSFCGLILLVPTGLKGWISCCWDVELLLDADCSVTSFCLLWTPCLTVNFLTNTGNADFLFCYIAETFYVVHIVLMEHGLFF